MSSMGRDYNRVRDHRRGATPETIAAAEDVRIALEEVKRNSKQAEALSRAGSLVAAFLAGAVSYGVGSNAVDLYNDQSCSGLERKIGIATQLHRDLFIPLLVEGAVTGKTTVMIYPYGMARDLSDRLEAKYALKCE